VERLNGATTEFASPTGTGCKTGSGGPRPTSASAESTALQAPPATTSAAGFFSTSPANRGGSASPTTVTPPPPPPPPATTTATASGHSGGSGSGSGSGYVSDSALSGACTSEGEFNCFNGGTRYQQCGSGVWSVAMPVAPGTKCAGGRGPALNVVPSRLRFRGNGSGCSV
jgi:hypothetical protein